MPRGKGRCGWVRHFGAMTTDRNFFIGNYIWGFNVTTDLTLNHTERSHTVCVVEDLYVSKRICGWAGYFRSPSGLLVKNVLNMCEDGPQTLLNNWYTPSEKDALPTKAGHASDQTTNGTLVNSESFLSKCLSLNTL